MKRDRPGIVDYTIHFSRAIVIGIITVTIAITVFEITAIAEVGAVIIVGGNIQHATRVMTTTIALETSKGNLALALGLGLILVTLALGVNATALVISDTARRRYG